MKSFAVVLCAGLLVSGCANTGTMYYKAPVHRAHYPHGHIIPAPTRVPTVATPAPAPVVAPVAKKKGFWARLHARMHVPHLFHRHKKSVPTEGE